MYIILRNENNFLKNNDCKYFSYFIDVDTQIKSILYENIAQSQGFRSLVTFPDSALYFHYIAIQRAVLPNSMF